MKKTIDQLLEKLDACNDAREWAAGKTWEEIYSTCHRGDWLLWLFKKTNPNDIRKLTLAKGYCAKTVLHLMKDQRSKDAVQAAIDFGDGKINEKELADYAAAAAAAYATATYATTYAAYVAAAAAYVAAAAAADAAVASRSAARTNNKMETADICRKYLPIEIWNISYDN